MSTTSQEQTEPSTSFLASQGDKFKCPEKKIHFNEMTWKGTKKPQIGVPPRLSLTLTSPQTQRD